MIFSIFVDFTPGNGFSRSVMFKWLVRSQTSFFHNFFEFLDFRKGGDVNLPWSNVPRDDGAVQNIGGFVCNLGESGQHLPQFPDINRGAVPIYWGNDYTSW
jgi:hypothetical protein